jgi:GNAT superfamily N-acetyltransferase
MPLHWYTYASTLCGKVWSASDASILSGLRDLSYRRLIHRSADSSSSMEYRSVFVLVKPDDDHLVLEHLYIVPEYQGKGIGSAVLNPIFAEADSRSIPVKVGALRDSDSNRFYQRHGFLETEEAEWDIYYVRASRRAR